MIRLSTNSFSWHPTYNQGLSELTGAEICRQAAACGAAGIELDPSRITAAELREIGIALSGASTGGPLFDAWTEADADKVVATAAAARALGADYVFFTAAPKGGWGAHETVTAENLALAGERLTALGARVRAEGMAIGLHNHAANPEGFAAELALVREHVDPALVGLYLDAGWAYCSDGDPAALVAEFGRRCLGFHFRNHTRDKVPTQTLTEGALDLPGFIRAIVDSGYSGWVALELWHRQDTPVTRRMVDCQRESLAWLTAEFGRAGARMPWQPQSAAAKNEAAELFASDDADTVETSPLPTISLDIGDSGDWAKKTWDLGIDNVEDLRQWLAETHQSVEHFKRLPVYRWNVDKLPWLKEL